MQEYLEETEIIDYNNKEVYALAMKLANGCKDDIQIAKKCSEYKPDIYCLHGLNWIYLKEFGWYRVDARGNKEGVDAQFNPPYEQLAFKLQENEFDLSTNLVEPLPVIVETLQKYKGYDEMIENFPDIEV